MDRIVRVTQELGETVWVHQEGVLGERNESLLRLCAESQKAGGDLTRGGRTGRVWRSRAGMERAYGE